MDLYELNQLWENYSVEVLYYEKKIEECKTVLNVLNEEMAFLRGGAAKVGYVYNEKLVRWDYSVEVLYYEKKIEECKTVLNVLNEEMAFLRGGAAKVGYVYNEKLGRWGNK